MTHKKYPKVQITCVICGTNFEVQRSQLKHRTPKYCGRECMGIGTQKPEVYIELPCDQCGKIVRKRKTHLKNHVYCSYTCSAKAKRKENPNWTNPDYIKAYMREYYRSNKETHKEQSIRWHNKHPEYKKEWCVKNKQKRIASALRHRHRKNNLPIVFSEQDLQHMRMYWEHKCAYCGNPEGLLPSFRLTVDHFIPLSSARCTGTIPTNLLPACKSCNSSKNANEATRWLIKKLGKDKARQKLKEIIAYFTSIDPKYEFSEVAA